MKLSVITINLNNAEGLRKTIESVVNQTIQNFEYIIIDGESTDGSVEVIRSFSNIPAGVFCPLPIVKDARGNEGTKELRNDKMTERQNDKFAGQNDMQGDSHSIIPVSVIGDPELRALRPVPITFWISEPDTGIYNAMNKGILRSTGEYCLFLNSGDWLIDENVVADFYAKNYTEDIVAGSVTHPHSGGADFPPPSSGKLTYDFFVHDSLMHQSAFIRRTLFNQFGLYDENYKIVSDWKFFFEVLILHNCSYAVFERAVAYFDRSGISRKPSYTALQNQEREQVLNELLPRVYPMYKELEQLRAVKQEYDFLKAGHLGFMVRFLLRLKALKKRDGSKSR